MDRIIYFGSSNFSKIILETLLEAKIKPLLVVTKPDAPKGRGLRLYQTQVAETAQNNNIKLLKPDNLKKTDFLGKVAEINPNYLAVADYGKIIPALLFSIPKTLPLGIHPSLLPLYRGPAPIERTLLDGRRLTGVTIFKLDKGVDTGPILLQKKIKVDANDTYFTLSKKLAVQGAKALIESLYQAKNAPFNLQPQDTKKATFAPKLVKQTGKINWNNSAAEIKNLIRATLSWPTAYTYYKNKVLKITEADTTQDKDGPKHKQPAIINKINKDGICVTTGSGILKIKKLKPEGKKEMPAWSFVCGHRVEEGDRFDTRK